MFTLVFLLVYLIFILQSVAYYTLMERHVLGMTQLRYGPKKTSIYGLLQPLMDGAKLLKKEFIIPFNVSPLFFIGATLFGFVVLYMEFLCLPYYFSFITLYWSYLLVMILVSMNVYTLLVGGVFSKSKYSYLGGMRSAMASIGYEVMFSLNMILFMVYSKSCTLVPLSNIGLLLMFMSFFISVLVELGRTPFDYSESESELVSGFNVEYSSASFVLIFLKEYGSLLFFSHMTSSVFFGGSLFFSAMVFTSMIFIRSSLPRLRYDKMVSLMWLSIFFHIGVSLFCSYYLLMV